MRRILIALPLLVVPPALAQAPVPVPSAQKEGPFEIIPVADDTKVLEEKSLSFEGQVMGSTQSRALPGDAPVGEGSRMSEMTEDAPNAFRIYGFILAPGEKLKLRLKGKTEGQICMKFLARIQADKMTAQVRRANLMPAPSRRAKIEIRNTMDTPYQVSVMLFGQANYPYRLEIERDK